MTSQRDETMGPTADDEMTGDPIIVERHDEILVSKPVDDAQADDVSMSGTATGDGTGSDELVGRHAVPDTDGPGLAPLVIPPGPAPADEDMPVTPAGMTPAETGPADPVDGPADHAGGPAAEPDSVDRPAGGPAAPGWAAAAGATAAGATTAAPESDVLETPLASSLDSDSLDTGTPETDIADTGTVDTGTPATPGAGPAGGLRGDGVPAAALAGQQWPAIQAMFVDDPKGSVQRAAAAADEVVKAFVASIEREQAALRTAWENDATTEDLRTALQQYRAFCGRLEGLA